MVSKLPAKAPVPWPHGFEAAAKWGDRVFGPQRKAALTVGLIGAYAGRALMLLLATFIIANPWLRLLGAAYLFKLAIEHLGKSHGAWEEEEEAEEMARKVQGKGFWTVVVLVNLADMAFSLDNVVAAVALSKDFWVVFLGVAIGILIMRFAAQIFTVMIEREPVLATAAYILVLAIGVEVLVSDATLILSREFVFKSWQKFSISVAILVLSVTYAHSSFLQRLLGPIFNLFQKLFFHMNRVVDLLFFPFVWFFIKLFQGVAHIFRHLKPSSRIA